MFLGRGSADRTETLAGGQGLPLGARKPTGMSERDADVDARFVDPHFEANALPEAMKTAQSANA